MRSKDIHEPRPADAHRPNRIGPYAARGYKILSEGKVNGYRGGCSMEFVVTTDAGDPLPPLVIRAPTPRELNRMRIDVCYIPKAEKLALEKYHLALDPQPELTDAHWEYSRSKLLQHAEFNRNYARAKRDSLGGPPRVVGLPLREWMVEGKQIMPPTKRMF